ncbi:MAG: threonylcarbamoyl-AMP synthase [Chloroflexi bacterium]|nr:threonylcarbamoyl-AMP synthase [Chloroflexota bacterium]
MLGSADLAECAAALDQGDVIALPTETVYGLAADARNEAALEKLQSIKGRLPGKTLPVQVAALDQVRELIQGDLSAAVRRLFETFSPGPLTVVVRGRENLPRLLQGPGGSVGIRIPDHSVTLQILRAAGTPLAITSANRTDEPPALDFPSVLAALGLSGDGDSTDDIAGIVDGGPCRIGLPSTVIDMTGPSPQILREGALPADEVLAVAQGASGPETAANSR